MGQVQETSLSIWRHKVIGTTYYSNSMDLENATTTEECLIETSSLRCTERHIMYKIRLSYTKGRRSLDYTMHDADPPASYGLHHLQWETSSINIQTLYPESYQEALGGSYIMDWKVREVDAISRIPHHSPQYAAWKHALKDQFRYWNSFAILSTFMYTTRESRQIECGFSFRDHDRCNAEWIRPNVTAVGIGLAGCLPLKGSECLPTPIRKFEFRLTFYELT